MKPSKLKRPLETHQPEHSSKDPSFFIRLKTVLNRARLDTTSNYQQHLFACIEASYLHSLRISRKHKPTQLEGFHISFCKGHGWTCFWK